MLNNKLFLFLSIIYTLCFSPLNLIAQCGGDISVEEAKTLIDNNEDLVLVDVREESEFCDENPSAPLLPGHIPGALNYPWISGVLSERFAELPVDGEILIICKSGGRGGMATAFLCDNGFTSVKNVAGGMLAWTWETVTCEEIIFKRGDTNTDHRIDVADAIFLLTYLFSAGDSPGCMDTADSNDDGAIDLADAIRILGYLFSGDTSQPDLGADCSEDSTDDGLICDSYPVCD